MAENAVRKKRNLASDALLLGHEFLVIGTGFLFFLLYVSESRLSAQTIDVLTYHNDMQRTGQYLAEKVLSPSNVNSNQFGKLWVLPADAEVIAEPLYAAGVAIPGLGLRNVLFIETENDTVYAYDGDYPTLLWQAALTEPGEEAFQISSCVITPELGVTATPVIDRQFGPNGTIFIEAMTQDSNGNAHQRLHALDLATGQDRLAPVEISASYPGTGDDSDGTNVVFHAANYIERACLTLTGGVIYTFWSAHCNSRPSTSWIIGYDEQTFAPAGVVNLEPNSYWGSIWNSSTGSSADTNGNLYVSVGDGGYQDFTGPLDANGFPADADYGNSLVKLSPTTNNTIEVADYFAMYNVVWEDDQDLDLGSGGTLVLPDIMDAQNNTRQLVVAAGKDENIYIADRSNLGKFNPLNNEAIYQEITNVFTSTNNAPPNDYGQAGGIWSMPAYFNGTLYFGPVRGPITAFSLQNARLAPNPSSGPSIFGYPGATPSVSANGVSNGIVWAVESIGKSGIQGLATKSLVLHAYDATNVATELYNSAQASNLRDQLGALNDFVTPMIANGHVYVASSTGIGVFGLISAVSVTASPANGGVVSGGGAFAPGSVCTVAASTNNSFIFLDWTQDGVEVSSLPNYTFVLDSNVNLTANFAPRLTITVVASPTNGGTVRGGGSFAPGTSNSLTAAANTNSSFTFLGWTQGGTSVSSSSNYSFVLDSNVTLVAQFAVAPNTVAAVASPANGGTVTGGGLVAQGGTSTLTETPASGFEFVGWSGAASGTSNSITLLVSTNLSVTANFAAVQKSFSLTVLTRGSGKASASPAPKVLSSPQTYTLTATPGSNNVFANWSGCITTNKNPFTLRVSTNMIVQANFVTNPFLPVFGTYNGLFLVSNSIGNVTEKTAGMLHGFTVNQTGAYSGSFLTGGTSRSFSGTFGLDGTATNVIKAGRGEGSLLVTMALNGTISPPQLTGWVYGTNNNLPWAAPLIANRSSNRIPSAQFTMAIPPETNSAETAPPDGSPGGAGYILITNNAGSARNPSSARATLVGELADGTQFSESVPVSQTGLVPLYASLYSGQGLLLGWINLDLTNATNLGASGLAWIHPRRNSGIYKNGFTNLAGSNQIQICQWTNSPFHDPIFRTMTNLSVLTTIDQTNALTNLVVAIDDSGRVRGGSVTGAINAKTGLLRVVIGNGSSSLTGIGAILLNTNVVNGSYLTKTNNAQAIKLSP